MNPLIGLVGTVFMILMVLVGIPVFVSMCVVSIVGLWLIGGWDFMLIQFTTGPFNVSASYQFAVIPLFVLMGMLAGESKVGTWAYEAIRRWIGKLRGGLLIATIFGNMAFGACSGMSTAGTAVFAKIALPELKRAGYDEGISMGCITAAGSLSSLIPPSMPILLFSILCNVSIGKAFMAGIGPGILMAILYSAVILLYARFKPNAFPILETKYDVSSRIKGLVLLAPIMVLFLIVIGGIYAGVFTPTVGGAIGSVAALLLALISGTSLKAIIQCLWNAARANGRIFPIIMSAMMFSRFIALSELPQQVGVWIQKSGLSSFSVYMMCMAFYLCIGCFMDVPSIIFITSPIVFPLLTNMGFDPLVVVISFVFMAETAGLTPPFGLAVFFLSSLLNVHSTKIFRAVWPFVIVNIMIVILFGAYQDIVTMIPKLLYK
ncbi:MAG: TRAP transporter large permease subunit [Candidatus Bathyarchaeia archaeon]